MRQQAIDEHGWSVAAEDLLRSIAAGEPPILVDLRERGERERRGVIPHSVHAPYGDTEENVGPGGLLHELAVSSRRELAIPYWSSNRQKNVLLALADTPQLLNDDPYGDGWICVIEIANASDLDGLLDAAAYRQLVED